MIRKPFYRSPRDNDEYRAARRYVYRRDKGKCQMPGCNSRRKIEVHHIIRYADSIHARVNTVNLICLCKKCHTDITGKEAHFRELLSKIALQNEDNMKKKKK